MSQLQAVEIFTGCGGSLLGSKKAGFNSLLSIECDKSAHSTLLLNRSRFLNIPEKNILHRDIREISFLNFSKPDLICGGPPCQPFSTGGQHLGPEDGRNMFPEAIRCIREMQPRAFILENVRGLKRQKFENYLEYLFLQLKYPELVQLPGEIFQDHHKRLEDHQTSGSSSDLRYNIVSRILNAADYGVPQIRERLFIVGFRNDEHHAWHFPEPTHSKDALLYQQFETNQYWQRHNLSRNESVSIRRKKARIDDDNLHLKPWKTFRDVIAKYPPPFDNMQSANEAGYPDHVFRDGARSYVGHTGSYIDEPSKTLKAGYNGVPGGENMLRYADNSVRYFTIREMAALQTFPLEYRFGGAWSAQIKQIGNAVPVKLFQIIAKSLQKVLTP